MALVPCPECGRKVSDRASACPACACPLDEVRAPPALRPLPAPSAAGPVDGDEQAEKPQPEREEDEPERTRRGRPHGHPGRRASGRPGPAGCAGCAVLLLVMCLIGGAMKALGINPKITVQDGVAMVTEDFGTGLFTVLGDVYEAARRKGVRAVRLTVRVGRDQVVDRYGQHPGEDTLVTVDCAPVAEIRKFVDEDTYRMDETTKDHMRHLFRDKPYGHLIVEEFGD